MPIFAFSSCPSTSPMVSAHRLPTRASASSVFFSAASIGTTPLAWTPPVVAYRSPRGAGAAASVSAARSVSGFPSFLLLPELRRSSSARFLGSSRRSQLQNHQIQPPNLLCFGMICSEGHYPSNEREASSSSNSKEVTFDIKLPRRNLLVEFTCNQCGERTKRLINRLAYEKGTIFLQCARCLVYHKFVDNLGLVVEYDLREEDEDSDVKGR